MEGWQRVPIVVPESQMQQFIAVSGTYDEQLIYLEPTELNLTKGTRVPHLRRCLRRAGGDIPEAQGASRQAGGRCHPWRHRVALATVHPSMIEVIK